MVVIRVVAAVGEDEAELGRPRDGDIDRLRRGAAAHHAGVEHLRSACVRLEHDRAVRAHLVVDADARLEPAAAATERVANVRGGVRPQTLRIGRAVERDRVPVAERLFGIRMIPFTGPQPLVEDVQLRSLRYEAGSGGLAGGGAGAAQADVGTWTDAGADWFPAASGDDSEGV